MGEENIPKMFIALDSKLLDEDEIDFELKIRNALKPVNESPEKIKKLNDLIKYYKEQNLSINISRNEFYCDANDYAIKLLGIARVLSNDMNISEIRQIGSKIAHMKNRLKVFNLQTENDFKWVRYLRKLTKEVIEHFINKVKVIANINPLLSQSLKITTNNTNIISVVEIKVQIINALRKINIKENAKQFNDEYSYRKNIQLGPPDQYRDEYFDIAENKLLENNNQSIFAIEQENNSKDFDDTRNEFIGNGYDSIPVYKWKVAFSGRNEKMSRYDLPLDEFLYTIKVLKTLQRISDVKILAHIQYLLIDNAKIWYFANYDSFHNWPYFVESIKRRFWSNDQAVDAFEELLERAQQKDENCIDFFDSMMLSFRAYIGKLNEYTKVTIIRNGLSLQLQNLIAPWRIKTLDELGNILHRLESIKSNENARES